MDIKRNLDLKGLLQKKSVLLLGPRGTGKSYYLRNQLENVHIINLLKSAERLPLQSNPSSIEEIVALHPRKIIVIDEVQKVPELLDEAHRLIEEKGTRFLLTGSSARKLKAEGVNLLAGRAWLARMFPFNYRELASHSLFDIKKILTFGSLPGVVLSEFPREELDSYVETYIESEIKSEGLIRKIPAFSRFLKTASLSSGELINFQSIASYAETPASTVKEYYKILEDTLIGFMLEPWKESKKRKAIATSKFYFFDIGVLNFLSDQFPENEFSVLGGNRFEHFIISEIRCANFYQRRKLNLNYWRSTSNYEVDLILGKTVFEIKSTRKASERHFKGLRAIREEGYFSKFVFISNDPVSRKTDNIYCFHYQDFLDKLWAGDF